MNYCIDQVSNVRKDNCNVPILFMTYLNPVFNMGYSKFAERASEAGLDGVLVVDLPPEDAEELCIELKKYNIDIVLLYSPTTNSNRIESYRKLEPGFLYYISHCGVTGMCQKLSGQFGTRSK